MKIVRANPSHAYHVFKILKDFAEDTGTPKPTMDKYENLLSDLLDDTKVFSLIMHGKFAAGMFWGAASQDKGFTVHGRFLRRKFRTFKFKKALVRETLAARETFGTLKLVLKPGSKVSPRYKPVCLLVEEVR